MEDEFYVRFEEKYRGTRELIKNRQKVYLPFLEILKEISADRSVIDMGCGRGEWLELLHENEWRGVGVDINENMVEYCKGLGLSAVKSDAISYLHSIDSELISVVSGFHISEHLPFELLQELVKEAYRVLRPGGLLILETPNPENIAVGTSSFYIDPSHNHPLPMQLLSFLPEYYGFFRTKILRLQETKEVLTDTGIKLFTVLSGVSPDYGIVAQKEAEVEVLSRFEDQFNQEFGISLDTLANRYDSQNIKKFEKGDQEIQKMKTKVDDISVILANLANERERLFLELEGVRSDLQVVRSERDDYRTRYEATLDQLTQAKQEVQGLYNSHSYRITAPMRAFFGAARAIRGKLRGSKDQPTTIPAQISSVSKEEPVNQDISPELLALEADSQNIKGMNLDEIMEKIRAEVARNNLIDQQQTVNTINQNYSVEDLLKINGVAFINNAYRIILKREPDRDGFNHFMTLLQSGKMSKLQILQGLRYSPEGKKVGVKINGLFE